LVNLTNLTWLEVQSNQISDVSPLVQNEGLRGLVDLSDNPLSPDSINIYIPQLQARGVTVYY
jgi:Leucine-rich repeat (LRR) protein